MFEGFLRKSENKVLKMELGLITDVPNIIVNLN